MGFMSHRRKYVEVQAEQKWDFISLNDFKSTSCFTPFAYGYLWFSLLLSVAVYAVDTFTAYQLLAFNRWSSQIAPTQLISFDISKWIFTICIILSFLNLGFEHFRAQKIMRRGSVAESFLDNLAVRLESIRMGKGRGWRRFLVFAELTKSKKGAEYVALFTYFSFQSWVRVIICSGPRQVINALTLYSVYTAKLSAQGANFESSIGSFFSKIKLLASEDYRQALILSGMLFTLVIWLFAFLSLLIAALFFVFFLWHYIPRDDGGLTGFCERKINKRLKQIVSVKINKAMAEDERKRRKAELKAAMKNGEKRPLTMQPSLPSIPNLSGVGGDKLPEMPMLSRSETMMTLDNASRPGTPGSFELNSLGQRRPMPTRTATMGTSNSFSSTAGLLNNSAEIGISRPDSPASSLPTPNGMGGNYPPPLRTGTTASNRSLGPRPPLNRMASDGSSLAGGYTASPAMYSTDGMPAFPPPVRSPTAPPGSLRGPGPNQANGWPNPGQGRPNYDEYSGGRASPAPSNNSYGGNPLSPRGMGPDGYPIRSTTTPITPRGPAPNRYPQRNMTAPVQGLHQHQQTSSNGSLRNMVSSPVQPYHEQQGSRDYDYGSRPATANSQRNGPGPRPGQQPSIPQLDRQPSIPQLDRQPSIPQLNQQPSIPRLTGSGDYDYFNRPATANSQRNGPRGGYGSGNSNGWNQDVERNGPRY